KPSEIIMRLTASAAVAALAGLVVLAPPAQAADPMTFVSTSGSDANACTRAAPCASIQRAAALVVLDGQVSCLDTGPILGGTISKSVTVDCATGATLDIFRAGSAQFGGVGLTINGGPTVTVKIRNLRINGEGFNALNPGGHVGIDFQSGAGLIVEHCAIENFIGAAPGHGIRVAPGNGITANVTVSHTVITPTGLATRAGRL